MKTYTRYRNGIPFSREGTVCWNAKGYAGTQRVNKKGDATYAQNDKMHTNPRFHKSDSEGAQTGLRLAPTVAGHRVIDRWERIIFYLPIHCYVLNLLIVKMYFSTELEY